MMPNIAMRSLLSAEGIRWFFGHFTQSLATPLLVWLVLGLIACGTLRASGLLALRRPLGFRERFALRVVAAEGAVVVVIMLLVVVVMMVVMFVLVVIMVVMVFVAVVVVMVMSVLSLLGLVLGPHLLQ